MTKLTEQLREALGKMEKTSLQREYRDLEDEIRFNLLPALLTEHEKLEREAEAGKVFVEKMQRLSDSGDCGRWLVQDLLEYRTACEK